MSISPLTRDAVVAATRSLIRDHGLDAVSLRQVAAALGVTAPALYAYVRDKNDLLRAVADEEFAALSTRFAEVVGTDPLDRTRGYCRAYVAHAVENPELFKVMFLFQPRIGLGEVDGAELASATETFGVAAEALVESIETGRLADQDPLIATLTIWMTMHGAAEVLLMGFDFSPEFRDHVVDTAIEQVLRGMGART